MFEWVKITYWKHKTSLCLFVVITVAYFSKPIEKYILESNLRPFTQNSRYLPYYNSSCSDLLCEGHNLTNTTTVLQTSSKFQWNSAQEKRGFLMVHSLFPVVAILFGGIYSDKYGGQSAVAAGVVVSSLIMSTCYLAVLRIKFVFLAMVVARRVSETVPWVAAISLAAKVASHDERSIFVSFICIGYSLGVYLGDFVSGRKFRWEYICELTAFVTFVTAVWWRMIYKRPRFPDVRLLRRVQWNELLTSESLYAASLLYFYSDYLIRTISRDFYVEYQKLETKVTFLILNDVQPTATLLGGVIGFLICGTCSDYLISKGIVSAIALRRGFIIVSLVLMFSVVAIVSLMKRNELVLLGALVAFQFTWSLGYNTAVATIIDFSPPCAGIVNAISYTFGLVLKYLLNLTLSLVFGPNYLDDDGNNWKTLFLYLILAFLGLLSSLPFLGRPFKCKRIARRNEDSPLDSPRTNQDSEDRGGSLEIPGYNNEQSTQRIKHSSSEP